MTKKSEHGACSPAAGDAVEVPQTSPATDYRDQYHRLLAEFDNAKKRLERERLEAQRFGAERVVRDLLPIVDSFDQALKTLASADAKDPVVVGVKLIHRQLHDLLNREGVQPIESVGQPFDPHRHEAAAEVPAADGQADHTIVEEIQKGYTMHGKVLRHAHVKIATKQPHTSSESEEVHHG